MTTTAVQWKDGDIATCHRPCDRPIMMWPDRVWRHQDGRTECPDGFDPNDPGHDWHAEPEPRSLGSRDVDLDEIEGRNIDSLSADAPYSADIWALAADRNTLLAEAKRLKSALAEERRVLNVALASIRVLRGGIQNVLCSDSVSCDPGVEALLQRALEVSEQQGHPQ